METNKIKTIKIKKITIIENEDVYDITTEKNHNFFANGILVHNCGEQPLPNSSACNLGSINLYEFIDKENKTFNWEEFKNQIIRCIYYLDLVIDATKYPLPIIEKRTKAIRPVGLGFMGLADTFIELGYRYGDNKSLDFCEQIGQYMAKYSLIASIELAKQKGSFKEYETVLKLLNQNVSYNKIVDDLNIEYDKKLKLTLLTNEELDDINWVKILVDNNSKYKEYILTDIYDQLTNSDNNIPWTFRNALKYIDDNDITNVVYDLFNTGLRNSRRLSIAPTGSISMILNSSSALEPNFAFVWDRYVVDNTDITGTKRVLKKYYHKLNTPDNRNNGLLITANELDWKTHLEVVKIFAQYIDSAISKTTNLPENGTVDEIKDIYMYCFDNNIKGITIYRDGSRDSQPIISKDKKEPGPETKVVEVVDEEYTSLEHLPQWLPAIRTKVSTPIGSVYVITTLFKNKPCEIYISAGKSGSQVKSMIESLSRVISIGLRSGVDINNIVHTLIGITENDRYIYETLDGEETWVSSTPDLIANILKDTIKLIGDKEKLKQLFETISNVVNIQVKENCKHEDKSNGKDVCPKCGGKLRLESGCAYCPTCNWSKCS